LLKAGCDAKAKAHGLVSGTALHRAAGSGSCAVVECSVKAGADVNAKGRDGRTALHWATGSDWASVVEVLLDAGADPHWKSHDGWTPLDCTARSGSSVVWGVFAEGRGGPERLKQPGRRRAYGVVARR
jgi:ankyrin repeat protein